MHVNQGMYIRMLSEQDVKLVEPHKGLYKIIHKEHLLQLLQIAVNCGDNVNRKLFVHNEVQREMLYIK